MASRWPCAVRSRNPAIDDGFFWYCLNVQSAERVATPVCVQKSKKFLGSLDMTYITKEMTNDDIGSAPSTLSKNGVVFGKTQRKACVVVAVGLAAPVSQTARESITHTCVCTRIFTYVCAHVCARVWVRARVQGMADVKRVPGPTYYAPRLGMVDQKDVYSKTNLKSSIRCSSSFATHIKLMSREKNDSICTCTYREGLQRGQS